MACYCTDVEAPDVPLLVAGRVRVRLRVHVSLAHRHVSCPEGDWYYFAGRYLVMRPGNV